MKIQRFIKLFTALFSAVFTIALQAQPTAFTYQGSLRDNELPVTGTYDFEFRLFDAATDGTLVGTPQTAGGVDVSGGLFTVVLDFGAVFDGSARYLDISVRPGSSNAVYTPLSPRQPITSTPYALKALEATTVPFGTITGNMLADGAVTTDKISAPGNDQVPVSDGQGGIVWMSVGDFLLAQNYNPPLPGIVENEATLEISGIFDDVVQIVNGPGIEIERVPSTSTESGLNTEFALVFDYEGSKTNDLQTWFDNLQIGADVPRSGSLIVERTDSSESFRWNLFEYELSDIGLGQGSSGKNRYTLTHALNPDRIRDIDMEGVWLEEIDDNQGVDIQVEISGIIFNVYPVVEDDPVNKTLTMTFDYSEAGDIWSWVEDIATGGTFTYGRKSISVIFERNDGLEIGRNNYFECFPIRYQHFTGFGQDTKAKALLAACRT